MPPSEPRIRFLGRGFRAEQVWRAGSWRPEVIALRGVSALYGAFMRARRAAYATGLIGSYRSGAPVISVGNLTVGGTGKTPFTRWLVDLLLERGRRPAILHGGYGADEPALHRAWFPQVLVIEERDRVQAARAAAAAGADVIVLDDALQHLRLARDLDIVLISADNWDQPQRLLPAGGWRERLDALPRGAVALITRKVVSAQQAIAVARAVQDRTEAAVTATCRLDAQLTRIEQPFIAVCSIADPRSFARQLIQLNPQVQEVLAYDDHYEYTPADAAEIERIAAGRAIVTTEKDAVKLKTILNEKCFVVTQQLVFESEEPAVRALIESTLA